jgi:cysteinyl-tRNA synthetase
LNYSDEQLNEAGVALTRLYTALRGLDSTVAGVDSAYVSRFEQAMDDDFNTPVALAVLFDLARELNSAKQAADTAKSAELAATLRFLGSLLGVLQHDADSFLQGDADDAVAQQIQARIDAKKAKNWALADQIRDELKSQGIILEDAPNGTTTWRREA